MNQFRRPPSQPLLFRGRLGFTDLKGGDRLADVGRAASGPSNLTVSVKKLQIPPQSRFAGSGGIQKGLDGSKSFTFNKLQDDIPALVEEHVRFLLRVDPEMFGNNRSTARHNQSKTVIVCQRPPC